MSHLQTARKGLTGSDDISNCDNMMLRPQNVEQKHSLILARSDAFSKKASNNTLTGNHHCNYLMSAITAVALLWSTANGSRCRLGTTGRTNLAASTRTITSVTNSVSVAMGLPFP